MYLNIDRFYLVIIRPKPVFFFFFLYVSNLTLCSSEKGDNMFTLVVCNCNIVEYYKR